MNAEIVIDNRKESGSVPNDPRYVILWNCQITINKKGMAKIGYQKERTANKMMSSMLIHPGEMIKDEIVARGLTQKDLAQQMGVSYTVFNEILNGKRPVTTEYALLLEAALGTDANIWIGLQADYNMQKMKQDRSFMKRLEKIRKIAAVF